MFTLDKFQNLYNILLLKSETSYFYLKNDYRKIEKKLLINIFNSIEQDVEENLKFYRNSPVFIKEDEEFFYLKNDYNTLPINSKNIDNFFNKINQTYPKNYKIYTFERITNEDQFLPFFNKNLDLIFPEIAIYIKKDLEWI